MMKSTPFVLPSCLPFLFLIPECFRSITVELIPCLFLSSRLGKRQFALSVINGIILVRRIESLRISQRWVGRPIYISFLDFWFPVRILLTTQKFVVTKAILDGIFSLVKWIDNNLSHSHSQLENCNWRNFFIDVIHFSLLIHSLNVANTNAQGWI